MTRSIGTAWLDAMLDDGWTSATVHAYLLTSSTAFDPDADVVLSDIPGIDRVSGPVVVTGKTASSGYFDADTITFTVADGVTVAWFVLVQVGGSEATSPIIGSTNQRSNNAPILYTGNDGTMAFNVQALGLGRI